QSIGFHLNKMEKFIDSVVHGYQESHRPEGDVLLAVCSDPAASDQEGLRRQGEGNRESCSS
ncbi:MAG TPA: hypothetical protein VMS32_05990, partial [Verrucomicrobiae bacterium]|nr:hypothetical protein [Verrucomicrobiae bacterium]